MSDRSLPVADLESAATLKAERPDASPFEVGRTTQRRASGVALAAAAAIFWLAEFIAAAAWSDPPYSYTYHYISNLGVHGPVKVLGQYMYSPLASVMNTGFFLFGVTVFLGVVMLRGLRGWRHWAALILAFLVAIGGVLLAFFHGDGSVTDGVDYHGLGAFASIVGGNVLIILLGRASRFSGIGQRAGTAMVVLGIIGLVSLVPFFTLAGAEADHLVGLAERCAVYPVLIGLVCAGVSIVRGQRAASVCS